MNKVPIPSCSGVWHRVRDAGRNRRAGACRRRAAEPAAAAAATQNPRDLINGVAQQLLKELQTRREELKK